jgi:hypothetical protein
MRRSSLALCMAAGLSSAVPAVAEIGASVPRFKATALSGERKTERDLLGEQTVLVLTPTRRAAKECKAWGETLERALPSRIGLWALLALDRPFFVSENYALRKAQEKVPQLRWEQTWLLTHGNVEKHLGVPSKADEPYIFAINSDGRIVAESQGTVTPEKIEHIARALRAARLVLSGSNRAD